MMHGEGKHMSKLFINEKKKMGHICPELYGQFAEHLGRCIYEGIYVGEDSEIPNTNGMRNDVVQALKKMKVPVLRWPGGCFADEYHWKDGIGPKENRKKMINTNWGGVIEDNSFGTDEFFELCRQLECKTYVNGNVGSGTVQEMSEWVEYIYQKSWHADYFGVGNESWGCGGNMTPEYYANLYRRYQTFCRNYDSKHPLYKICCGPNMDDYAWTKEVMKTAHDFMDGFSLHYYVFPDGWDLKGSATEFDEKMWFKTIAKAFFMEKLIQNHGAIMDEYDPDKKIGLIVDEWGCWFTCEPGTNPGFLYQQNTMRDALVACLSLNIFNKHCDRVKMANIAQLVNVLQSVILTEGAKMLLTPTYYVFRMYKYHQNAQLLESYMETEEIGTDSYKVPDLSESVSMDDNGTIHITLGNLSPSEGKQIEVQFTDRKASKVSGTILTGNMAAYNTFDEPENVKEQDFTDYSVTDKGDLNVTIPPCCVIHLEIKA